MDFCKNFNNLTVDLAENIMFPVSVIIYLDYSYDFIIKLPTTTSLIKKLLFNDTHKTVTMVHFKRKIRRQLSSYNRKREFFIYFIPVPLIFELTQFKMLALSPITINLNTLKMINGSLYSMGIGIFSLNL
jgi:ribosomal protein L11